MASVSLVIAPREGSAPRSPRALGHPRDAGQPLSSAAPSGGRTLQKQRLATVGQRATIRKRGPLSRIRAGAAARIEAEEGAPKSNTLANWNASLRSNRERGSQVVGQHRREKTQQLSLLRASEPNVGRSVALASRGLKAGFAGLPGPPSKQASRGGTLYSGGAVNIGDLSSRNVPERTKFKIATIGVKLEERLHFSDSQER